MPRRAGALPEVGRRAFGDRIQADDPGDRVALRVDLDGRVSIAGRGISASSSSAYAAAKGGIIAFTRKLSLEVAPFGITVNAIAPSLTLTERLRVRRQTDSAIDREEERVDHLSLDVDRVDRLPPGELSEAPDLEPGRPGPTTLLAPRDPLVTSTVLPSQPTRISAGRASEAEVAREERAGLARSFARPPSFSRTCRGTG